MFKNKIDKYLVKAGYTYRPGAQDVYSCEKGQKV